jgi:hypothetical protein
MRIERRPFDCVFQRLVFINLHLAIQYVYSMMTRNLRGVKYFNLLEFDCCKIKEFWLVFAKI